MILDRIEIENFGVYGGRQEIDLAPCPPERNVILFGALNGGGKTTLLDALQLVLYGKRAKCHNREGHSYGEFLRSCIHRGAGSGARTGIVLEFRSVAEGVEMHYSVNRSWAGKGKTMSDRVEVAVDGSHDQVLSDTWDDFVEELIPSRIAPLFFFDGEKIEALANPDTSREILASALHSLLGLDLVEQLRTDLLVLQRRRKTEMASNADVLRIQELQSEVSDLEQRRTELKQERAQAKNQQERVTQNISRLDEEFSRQGGTLFEQRASLEHERNRVDELQKQLGAEMRALVAGPLPLTLLRSQLESLRAQASAEEEGAKAAAVIEELQERDTDLLRFLTNTVPDGDLVKRIDAYLAQDRQSREAIAEGEPYLHLPEESIRLLSGLLDGDLPREIRNSRQLLAKSEDLGSTLVDLDRKLNSVPDEDAIAALLEERARERHSLAGANADARVLDEEIARVSRELDEKERALTRIIEQGAEREFSIEGTGRMIRSADSARDVLAKFQTRLVASHVERIGDLVTECYLGLIRKKSLVSRVSIAPETLVPQLFDAKGEAMPTDRLSAGERQLLAVSLLWGLAKASGRQLPVVIDTPLGRLDSDHRQHLVKGYFPEAGSQVILLSTDEEISGKYYRSLSEVISREYTLAFDDGNQTTSVLPGYPWK